MPDLNLSAELLGGIAAAVGGAGALVWLAGRHRQYRKRLPGDQPEAYREEKRRKLSWEEAEDAAYAESASADVFYEAGSYPSAEEALAPVDPARPQRFANVVLTDLEGRRPVRVPVGSEVLIEVDIGPLRADSDIADPESTPFPDYLLPAGDLEITVVLSSTVLDLEDEKPGSGRAAEAALVLPRDGGPSRRAEGEEGPVRFRVRVPEELRLARARLSYLYRDTVVQSQRLDLLFSMHEEQCLVNLSAITDFSISAQLDGHLHEIVDRPRVAVVPNRNPGGTHEVTVRPPAGAPAPPIAFQVNEGALGRLTQQMRKEFTDRAAPKLERTPRELKGDLEALAPLGWRICSQIDVEARRAIAAAEGGIVQVALPLGADFTLPWHLVYDIFIDASANPAKLDVCPIVDELADGYTFPPGTRTCPHESSVSHLENLLCPFGFWGYRFDFELLASTRSPAMQIEPGAQPTVTLARTEVGVDRDLLNEHLQRLGQGFAKWSSGVTVREARTKQEVREGLCADLPFVYFLCHGEHSKAGTTVLSVGKNEAIEPADFEGWVEYVFKTSKHKLWSSPRPLVFINACESLAIAPDDLVSYLGAFIGTGQAAGVIGTETRVNPRVAMDVAERFFAQMLGSGATVGEALSEIKLHLLGSANIAGLNYTPFCFADLKVGEPASSS